MNKKNIEKKNLAESHLFEPLEKYFTNLGYTVKAEVKQCDLVAVKEDEVLIIELKKSFNTKLLYQGVRRLSITPHVYVCFFKPLAKRNAAFITMVKSLSRRLHIGAFMVNSETFEIKEITKPGPFSHRVNKNKRDSLLKEFHGRKAAKNIGGVNKKKIETRYLECSIHLANVLHYLGSASAPELQKWGCCENSYRILYNNYYGWFSRSEKKTEFKIDPQWVLKIQNQYPAIWSFYEKDLKKKVGAQKTKSKSSRNLHKS